MLIPILIAFFLFNSCESKSYRKVEKAVEKEALNYIKANNINVYGEQYIEISLLNDIEGTELCSKASGVIVKNNNGTIEAEAYLKCDDYESQIIKNKSKYISLNGNSVILLNVGEAFNDPLYEMLKNCNVIIDGAVGTSTGIYTIRYLVYVDDKLVDTLYRKVIISKFDNTLTVSQLKNKTNPVITLKGDKEVFVYRNQKYSEPGYTAVDYVDGSISRKVQITPSLSKINTSKPGTYTITYTVTNSRGNIAIEHRTLIVQDRISDINISLEKANDTISNKVEIKVIVNGSDYSYMVLPNGKRDLSNVASYIVESNGKFTFRIYDRYDNLYTREIEIDNIDSVAPTGTCKATISSGLTEVEVKAEDNKGIASYAYIIDGKQMEYVTANKSNFALKATSVSAKVKDIAGNESTLKCELEEKSIITSKTSCAPSDVYITINTCFLDRTIRRNVPLEEYLMGVLYGEMGDGYPNEDLLKAFVIFARSFTLNRIRYWNGKNNPIRSCSSDQNWCDFEQGCYRDQDQDMFDACIDFAIKNDPRYTASTCANRVTTYPGKANISNKTFYTNNPNWTKERTVTSTSITPSWKGPIRETTRALFKKVIEETAGLIIYKSPGNEAAVGYYLCGSSGPDNNRNIMCVDDAIQKANKGYTMEELIVEYTQDYKNRIVDCYNK